jgi:ribosomal protein S8E
MKDPRRMAGKMTVKGHDTRELCVTTSCTVRNPMEYQQMGDLSTVPVAEKISLLRADFAHFRLSKSRVNKFLRIGHIYAHTHNRLHIYANHVIHT